VEGGGGGGGGGGEAGGGGGGRPQQAWRSLKTKEWHDNDFVNTWQLCNGNLQRNGNFVNTGPQSAHSQGIARNTPQEPQSSISDCCFVPILSVPVASFEGNDLVQFLPQLLHAAFEVAGVSHPGPHLQQYVSSVFWAH